MSYRDRDRDRRRDRFSLRLNQRDHSPRGWQQDPYLSSAGDGPGVWDEDDLDRD